MRQTVVSIFGSLVILAGSVPALAAEDTAGVLAADKAATVNDPNKIVCRQLEPATGTRIGTRRVCKTQREWDQDHQRAADDLSNAQIDRSAPTGSGG